MVKFRRFEACAISVLVVLTTIGSFSPCLAQQVTFPAPKYPVQFFQLQVEKQDLRIAYRDVPPAGTPNEKQCFCCTERISPVITGSPPSNS